MTLKIRFENQERNTDSDSILNGTLNTLKSIPNQDFIDHHDRALFYDIPMVMVQFYDIYIVGAQFYDIPESSNETHNGHVQFKKIDNWN